MASTHSHLVFRGGGVEAVLVLYHIAVLQQLHNLKLSILETLVLQYFFYSHGLTSFKACCLEHHTEGPVAHHALGRVRKRMLPAVWRCSRGSDHVSAVVRVRVHRCCLEHEWRILCKARERQVIQKHTLIMRALLPGESLREGDKEILSPSVARVHTRSAVRRCGMGLTRSGIT